MRRGYFVRGLGGVQFAQPGALERLRARREAAEERPAAVVLAAADPANPWGAALVWPKTDDVRLQRAAGAHVVLVEGRLVAWISKGRGAVVPLLPEEEPVRSSLARAAAQALRAWAERTGRFSLGWAVGEGPALAEGPLAPFLAAAGFLRSGPGFRLAVSATAPAGVGLTGGRGRDEGEGGG